MRDHPGLVVAPSLEGISAAAAGLWVSCAAAAIARNGRFTVALAGGSTPRRLYELLATPHWADQVDWARCHIFWGDERLVPPDHPDSNYRLAYEALLDPVPVRASHVHRIRTELGAAAAGDYAATLAADFMLGSNALPRFDLILLGLGSDGHTASLFPGLPALAETQALVVNSPPGTLPPPVDRVTLTLPVLNAAATVAFLVAGLDKAMALRAVLSGDQALPAARVEPANGTLHWFADAAAARALVRK